MANWQRATDAVNEALVQGEGVTRLFLHAVKTANKPDCARLKRFAAYCAGRYSYMAARHSPTKNAQGEGREPAWTSGASTQVRRAHRRASPLRIPLGDSVREWTRNSITANRRKRNARRHSLIVQTCNVAAD